MLLFNLSNPILIAGIVIALLIAITVHEFAHAWVANYYGDPTAKLQGRLTLNPIAHLDLMGTIFLLLVGFGWGKPVMVNPNNFRNPKLDNLTVSLAGPISNLLLATFFGIIYRFVPFPPIVEQLLILIIFFNLVLMIFNLIPIPPLDGSKVLSLFLREETYIKLQQMGVFILFLFIIIFYRTFPTLIFNIVGFFFTLITGKPITV